MESHFKSFWKRNQSTQDFSLTGDSTFQEISGYISRHTHAHTYTNPHTGIQGSLQKSYHWLTGFGSSIIPNQEQKTYKENLNILIAYAP